MSPNGLTTQNYWLFYAMYLLIVIVDDWLPTWLSMLGGVPWHNHPQPTFHGSLLEAELKVAERQQDLTLAGKKSSRFSTTFGRDSWAFFTVAAVFVPVMAGCSSQCLWTLHWGRNASRRCRAKNTKRMRLPKKRLNWCLVASGTLICW